MSKILVEDREGNTRVPFLRGILTRSLQDSGLPFDAAYELATETRNNFSDKALITTEELRKRVQDILKDRAGRETLVQYRKQQRHFTTELKHKDGTRTPFSRLEYQHHLEAIGLSSDEAMDIVAVVHKHLINRQIEEISSSYLHKLTFRYLRQSPQQGHTVSQRWLVWREFVNSGKPLIFLIGGTAGCGKSTIATKLANRLDIVRTQSTDMLREVMRTMMPAQLVPALHTSSFSAWTTMPGERRKSSSRIGDAQIVSGYRSQADLLSVAIEAVIQRALNERVSLILEGVHVHPILVEKLRRTNEAVIMPIMLGVLKRKQLQNRILGRGSDVPQRRADRYLEHFDEIWRLQSYLLSDADRAEIPIVINSNKDQVFSNIMRITIDALSENFDHSEQTVFD